MINLRSYQLEAKTKVYEAWNAGFVNVLIRIPTGGGKTKTFCSIIQDNVQLPTVVIVHRKELVQQICLTLAEEDIKHNIIASKKDIRGIIAAERQMFNRQFYDPYSPITVISVDTLLARKEVYAQWVYGIRRAIIDEAAHVLLENKWGKAFKLFPNVVQGLGVTATPERLDRKGLGRHADGIFDIMVEGPDTRWLIDNNYLSKYKIACPPSDYSEHLTSSSDTSDYSSQAMISASNKSHIVGDVVENYLKFANGMQAILFATDVGTAEKMEKQFLDKGISAKSLDGTTPDSQRLDSLVKFREKHIKVLINVDLFDEGLDVPGIECVIMARPTKSLGKYLQMVGRGLRVAPGKPHMVLIDHVGNVKHHGFPCDQRRWTLDRISKRQEKLNFIRICSNIMCNAPYDRALTECPWCGTEPIKQYNRSAGSGKEAIKQVDGDLVLIDPEYIREMNQRMILEEPANVAQRVGAVAGGAAGIRAMHNQVARIESQKLLAEAIAKWAGYMKKYRHYNDRNIHKCFYLFFYKTITEALGEPKEDMDHTRELLEAGID